MKPETKKNVLKYYKTIKGTDSKEGSELTDKAIELMSMSWKYIEWAKLQINELYRITK